MVKKLATVLLFVIAFLILFFVFIPEGHAEAVSDSPSVDSLYRIESKNMVISSAPFDLMFFDAVRVDLNTDDIVSEDEDIEAIIHLPIVPEHLEYVFLFDGWHVASGRFKIVSDSELYVEIRACDLKCFDGTVGIYLFFMGHEN